MGPRKRVGVLRCGRSCFRESVAGGGREKPRRRRVCARAAGSVFVEEALVG